MKMLRFVGSLLVILLAVVSLPDGVGAAPLSGGSTSCQSYVGSHACRRKEVNDVSASAWNAQVKSYMTNPVISIGTIGFSYWTVRETCDGIFTHQTVYSGTVDHNTSLFWDSSARAKYYCSGYRAGWSAAHILSTSESVC